ncbi:MAG TPA: mannose-1-phosphate guanylyltransferase [Gemmatimonadaceae bacterium]|nr:mannose-1-phosphate guanylyltransferase [Gemmatimonadaceae bacterium]
MKRWAVVLAGGVGTRFWPLSTPARPKQLLPLVDDAPLLRNTLDRLAPLVEPERTLVLTNASLTEPIRDLASELPRGNVIAEPRPAGTAAALAYAATEIERRDGGEAVMICVHADWAVGVPEEFRRRLAQAADLAARRHALVTVGIVPTRPDPGFGYIQPGEPIEGDARRVARFVEKPDRARAEQMVSQGYLWNSGIFVWRAGDLLDEIRKHTPEVAGALEHAGDAQKFFAAAKSVSVDVGVLERSDRVIVVPGDFAWDDVGTWAALLRVRQLDDRENATRGAVHMLDASRNVIHAEGGAVVLYGVSDLVVVVREGLTVVTTVDRAAELKTLIEALPADIRDRA